MSEATLDGLLARVASIDQANPKAIAQALSQTARRDDGSAILRSALPNNTDPLQVLSPESNTLPFLYILSARLNVNGPPNVHPASIVSFCQNFNPAHARCAPARITIIARAIPRLAEQSNDIAFALETLHTLLTRYSPAPNYFTTIHPVFLLTCIQARAFDVAVPIIEAQLTEFDKTLTDLDYLDHLQYFYLGGIVFAVLRRFEEAEDFFETAVSAPAQAPSAVQLEAYKKLTLIQLIRHGQLVPPPKYTNGGLNKPMKSLAQYSALVRHYPASRATYADLLQKEGNFFAEEGNLGLVRIVIEYAPRWALRNLMKTYSSLSLAQVSKLIESSSVNETRDLVLNMISTGELSAVLTPEGEVVFKEDVFDEAGFNPQAIQNLLIQAQSERTGLADLGRNMNSARAVLAKAIKERDNAFGPHGSSMVLDEEDWQQGGMVNEMLFDA